MIRGQRRKLVTEFAELRLGDKIVDTGCTICGRDECESMLLVLHADSEDLLGNERGKAWELVPACGPIDDDDTFASVDASMVADRRIYKLVEGTEIEQEIFHRERLRTGVRA